MSDCIICGGEGSVVVETRALVNGWLQRRRRCKRDKTHRWKTYELTAFEIDLSAYDPNELKEKRRNHADDQTERDALCADDQDAA